MTRHLCMWSGPRNISTTMMRSFGNRADTRAVDEPFYAHYLAVTGINHPMREETLASQPQDWRDVVTQLQADTSAPVIFMKQMTHHITPDVGLDWLAGMDHFFLIRDPRLMAASFAVKMDGRVSAADLGLADEARLFDIVRDLTGKVPPVVDAADILTEPRAMLTKLCDALALPFDEGMLEWPAGRKPEDGVWGAHWYGAVEASTGFRPYSQNEPALTAIQQATADACLPYYERLHALRLTPR